MRGGSLDNKIIILCGKSSVGKDTLARMIEKLGYNFIISTTTRPMRDGESEGSPYYFVEKDRFLYLIANNELLEYRTYNTKLNGIPDTWYYGIESKYIKEDEKYIGVLDIEGLRAFKNLYGDRVISFYIEADNEKRKQWAMSRGGFDESEWDRREKADDIDFSYKKIAICDYVLFNRDLNYTFTKIKERV